MTLPVPRLPFSLDPLIAEAKRRARRRRLLLALGVAVGAAVAVTFALQPGAHPGGAPVPAGGNSGAADSNQGPVLAGGVAPVTGGRVVATFTPDTAKVGQTVRAIPVATAPIDASGNFVLRPDPASRPLARVMAQAIGKNNGWVNLELLETGAGGRTAVTNITRQYVDASGTPFSPAEFRAAPGSGHWIGDGTGGTTVNPGYEIALPRNSNP